MPTLSSQYAYVTLPDGTRIEPITTNVRLSETWAPYCQATIVVSKGVISPADIDPRQADRIRLTLQQDFGDLIYVREITADYTGSVSAITAGITPSDVGLFTRKYTKPWNIFEAALPLSTVTTAYTPVTPLKLTNAGLSDVWRMSDFLNDSPTWNPATSTIFEGSLHVREVVEDFIEQTVEITATSDEGLAIDKYGIGISIPGTHTTLRSAITALLANVGLGEETDVTLAPGSDNTLDVAYVIADNQASRGSNLWDTLETITKASGFTIWCDENRTWHLEPTTITAGTLELKDDDNITAFTRTISRNGNWYNQVAIQYTNDYDVHREEVGLASADRHLYLDRTKVNVYDPDGAYTTAQRTYTRGETFTVEAISNYDSRPRQELTVDVTGIPLMSGVVQSVEWSLPSARMSLDIRDLQEV